MALIKLKPTTPGQRAVLRVVNKELHKGKPVAALLEKKTKTAGRNNNGHITTRHMGGGHKQHYRLVDFKRNKMVFRLLLNILNTIQIVVQTWLCCAMRTVSDVTLWLLKVFLLELL